MSGYLLSWGLRVSIEAATAPDCQFERVEPPSPSPTPRRAGSMNLYCFVHSIHESILRNVTLYSLSAQRHESWCTAALCMHTWYGPRRLTIPGRRILSRHSLST